MSPMTRKPKPEGQSRHAAARSAGARDRVSVKTKLTELRQRLLEISDLHSAGAVLSWDQASFFRDGAQSSSGCCHRPHSLRFR